MAGELEGLTLEITPQIDGGGMVTLSVAPTFSEKAQPPSGDANGAPVLSLAAVDTVMRVRDGESILLSGMLQRKGTVRTELVILLTATIVTPGPPARTGAR